MISTVPLKAGRTVCDHAIAYFYGNSTSVHQRVAERAQWDSEDERDNTCSTIAASRANYRHGEPHGSGVGTYGLHSTGLKREYARHQ